MEFDVAAATIISVAAFLDIAFRGLAFRRIDSFGLSLAQFSTVYSAVELARAVDIDMSASLELQRFGAAAVPLIALILYHIWCRENLEGQFDELLEGLQDRIDNSADAESARRRESLKTIIPIARNSVLVTFVGRRSAYFRPGKRTWREQVVRAVNTIAAPQSGNPARSVTTPTGQHQGGRIPAHEDASINESQLLLPAWIRRLGATLFLVGGLFAFFAQVVSFN